MLQTDLRTQVLSVLEDPGGFRFKDPILTRYTTEAVRRVSRAVGNTQRRLALSLVESQQEYLLPASGVARVISVQIIPETGSGNPPHLQQVDLNDIPIMLPDDAEPRVYSLDLAAGVNGDQKGINMFPAPARSTADAIVVTYEADFVDDVNLPFPSTFDIVLVRLTAAGCLSESDDEASVKKGAFLQLKAEDQLSDISWQDSLSRINTERSFP